MKVHLIAPARYLDNNQLSSAKMRLEEAGFIVSTGKNITSGYHYFSAPDTKRLTDLQQALDDETIDFIMCTCGGYGTIRLVEKIDFTRFCKQPKWLMGFSDITVLHNKMRALGIPSVHCIMPSTFAKNTPQAFEAMLNVIHKRVNHYEFAAHPLNREGQVTAPVVGGNLSILSSLTGTPLELETAGCILFIEDTGEAVYSIERMLWQLKLAGKLNALKGLIVGGITNVKKTSIPYGETAEAAIDNMVTAYNFPVCYHFPAGHIDDNRAVVLGKKATLTVSKEKTTFVQ